MATYDYVNAAGVIIPDTSEIKADVEAEYKEIYGDDLVVDSSSEQGREIDAETTSRMSVIRNNAKVANQINPNYAEGIFFDAIYALSSGERDGEERSTVTLTLGGVSGTIVTAGSLAGDDSGNLWELAGNVEIGVSGTVTAGFFSVEYGAINASPGEINTISSGVLGWETVTNLQAATPGKLQQSDVSAKRQRRVELGGNARSNTFAIMSAISKVEGVSSLTFRENKTSIDFVEDGITITKKSTYVCVDGGVDSEIAEAYYIARSGGTDFVGDVSVVYEDPNSLQSIPVKFDRPTDKPKLARVTVKASSGLFLTDAIKNSVVAYANGEIDGEQGFVVGGNVSAFEIGSAVNASVSNVFVSKCEIAEKEVSPTYTTDTIVTKINEKASITAGDVEVVIL